MAEANTAEVEAKVDAAFGGGFDGTPPAPAAKVVAVPMPEPAKPVAVVAPVPVPEKPQYVRLTKQEWDNAKASVLKVSSLESKIEKISGSILTPEQIIQRAVKELQAQTPAGSPVELTDDDFAEWKETFPEVGETMRKSLDKIVKRLNVRGTATASSPAPTVDIGAEVDKRLMAREAKALEKAYPDWSDIVGRPAAEGADPAVTDFRQWLAKQPADYQKEINETDSPAEVQAAIKLFRDQETTKPTAPAQPDKAAARRERIADAVTPRADGNPPPSKPQLSAEEAFGLGFKTGKPH